MARNGTEPGKSSLTERQKRALPILASASSIAEAARLSDLGRRTLRRWLDDSLNVPGGYFGEQQ